MDSDGTLGVSAPGCGSMQLKSCQSEEEQTLAGSFKYLEDEINKLVKAPCGDISQKTLDKTNAVEVRKKEVEYFNTKSIKSSLLSGSM